MRRAQELELGIGPRPIGSTLQRWLYAELRASILSGRIKAGQRLPSTRELARQQGISRGSVLSVYEQLAAEGYLAGTAGSGTTVACALPAADRGQEKPAAKASPLGQTRLSVQGERLAASPFPVFEAATPLRTFRANQPDLHAFPVAIWHKLQQSHRSSSDGLRRGNRPPLAKTGYCRSSPLFPADRLPRRASHDPGQRPTGS
ncbi:GntR family transcriptional regulator [Dechloromonas denitrificans]|uniref:GntR family transcriptional regulator n=1 Tax=Dechloromonas denitrificans TaxID=281362 RepID=UPI000B496737|nr:GntR family transcriptional regulator [Dechloromonas denitrificans]